MFRNKMLTDRNVILQTHKLWRVAHINAKHIRRKLQKITSATDEISSLSETNLKNYISYHSCKRCASKMNVSDVTPSSSFKVLKSTGHVLAGLSEIETTGSRSCLLMLKMRYTDHGKLMQQVSDIAGNIQVNLGRDVSANVVLLNDMKTSNFCTSKRQYSTQIGEVIRGFSHDEKENTSVSTNKIDTVKPDCEQLTSENNSDLVNPNQGTTFVYKAQVGHPKRSPILQAFPAPKNVLHNIFQVLSGELNRNDIRLNPQYKLVQSKGVTKWSCTYNLKWPEATTFVATSDCKKDASKKAAIAALTWLKGKNKIDDLGHPILYNSSVELKKLRKDRLIEINCDTEVVRKMNDIIAEFNGQMFPHIIETRGNEKDDTSMTDVISKNETLQLKNKRIKHLGLSAYSAKEATKLPISGYKKEFVELLKQNRVMIIKGEPGCGKSTRIPQYVLEHWATEGDANEFCRIAVTQPRRIAAISLAERVAHERGESTGDVVGYHVRLKSNFLQRTGRVMYCTTGILLRHLQTDLSLNSFSHVLLDEAHERDVNTDLLMNLLRKALTINPKLKLVIMSATIDTDIFKNYFNDAPVMVVPGFTHPVKSFYLDTCRRLDLGKSLKMAQSANPYVVHDDVAKVIMHIHRKKGEGAILVFLPGWDDISKVRTLLSTPPDMSVLCLHSRLQDSDQYRIFSKPPPGIRKVILATNIAETSVTIDDVVYVIDTGIHKEPRFDVDRGVACIDNHWISLASMTQRKGRAGRVQPGECFHLYSKAQLDSFEKFTVPEILKTSLTKVILDSKVFSHNMNALDFTDQLLTPPEENAVLKAVEELKELELLDADENLTPLGRTLADFQLEPKLSKAMVNSVIFKCATPVVDIATLFSAETEFFTSGLFDKNMVKTVKQKFSSTSDHLALMRLFEKWAALSGDGSWNVEKFCNESGLVGHKMNLIAKLKNIHFDYLYNGLYDVLPISDDYSDNDELVKAVILCGVGNFLQHRNWDFVKGRYKAADIFLTRRDHKAKIAQESVNSKRRMSSPGFLMHINETRSNITRVTLIRECSIISPLTLLLFSSKNIQVTEENSEDNSDLVQLSLVGTNVKVSCDRQDARVIVSCKEALFAGYKFYINLLTQGGDYNPKVNESWDTILSILSDLLTKLQVK